MEESVDVTTLGREWIQENLMKYTCYDLLPISFRLCVFDTHLLVKKALTALLQNNIHAAPLWNPSTGYAGMLTVTDFIHLIRYYYHSHSSYESAMKEINECTIEYLKQIEKTIGVHPPKVYSLHPMQNMIDCTRTLIAHRVNRIPLVDRDGKSEMVIGLISQYRVLKFIAANFNDPTKLKVTLQEMGIGTFGARVARVAYDTPLIQVLEMFLRKGISAVPIVDHKDEVLDIYEKYDVLALAREGVQHDLESPVGEAVRLRSSNDLLRVHTCTLNDTLYNLLEAIRKGKVHRFVIIDDGDTATGPSLGSRRLSGILTLSDLLKWIIKTPHKEEVH